MVFLALIWLKIAIYGLVVGRLFFGNLEPIPRLWGGIFIITIVTQIFNFFVPVNSVLQQGLDVIIFTIALIKIKKLKQDFYDIFEFLSFANSSMLVVAILLPIIVLFVSSAPSTVTDVGFYYLQSIKWIQNYPAVKGLGNLFTRLANNSNWFISHALFNPYLIHPAYALNGFLLFTTVIFLLKLYLSPLYDFSKTERSLFLILASLPILTLIQWHVESQNTDVPVTLLFWMIFGLFMLGEKDLLRKTDIQLLVSFLALFLPTIKLNYLPVVLIPLYYIMKRPLDCRKLVLIILIGSAIYIPYCIRSVIVSGYVIFPIYQIDLFNFDWKMPKEILVNENQLIKWWARVPNIDTAISSKMSLKEWLPIWILSQSLINKFLLVTVFTGIVLYVKDLIFKKTKEDFAILIIFLVSVLGILVCFITAPDLRFCYGFLIVAIAISYKEQILRIFDYIIIQKVFPLLLIIGLIANAIYIAKTIDTGLLLPNHKYPASKRAKIIGNIKIYMAQSAGEMGPSNENDSLWIKMV